MIATTRGRAACGRRSALWRGPPLADFAYEPFAQSEIARLEEARLAALEDRIDADLALGEHAGLVGELEALVREHPLRERLQGQLMLALYRSGRQADALEALPRRAARRWSTSSGSSPAPRCRSSSERSSPTTPRCDPPAAASTPRRRAAARANRRRGGALIAAAGAVLLAALVGRRGRTVGLGRERGHGARPTRWRRSTLAATASSVRLRWVPDRAPIAFGSGSLWVANLDDQTVSRVDPASLRTLRDDPGCAARRPGSRAAAGASGWSESDPDASSVSVSRDRSAVRRRRAHAADRQRRPGRPGGGRRAGQLGLGRTVPGAADAAGPGTGAASPSRSIRTPARPGSRSARAPSG